MVFPSKIFWARYFWKHARGIRKRSQKETFFKTMATMKLLQLQLNHLKISPRGDLAMPNPNVRSQTLKSLTLKRNVLENHLKEFNVRTRSGGYVRPLKGSNTVSRTRAHI